MCFYEWAIEQGICSLWLLRSDAYMCLFSCCMLTVIAARRCMYVLEFVFWYAQGVWSRWLLRGDACVCSFCVCLWISICSLWLLQGEACAVRVCFILCTRRIVTVLAARRCMWVLKCVLKCVFGPVQDAWSLWLLRGDACVFLCTRRMVTVITARLCMHICYVCISAWARCMLTVIAARQCMQCACLGLCLYMVHAYEDNHYWEVCMYARMRVCWTRPYADFRSG